MPQFKPGDVVRLKSGGPNMTMIEVADLAAGMGTGLNAMVPESVCPTTLVDDGATKVG